MAAVDYFLKLEGCEGESGKKGFEKQIEIESFSWGANNQGTSAYGGGGGAGKVQMQDFHFVMKVNKASPILFLRCADGKHLKEAILTCRKAGEKQQEFLKVTMNDLLVTSYQTGGSGGSDVIPMDSISLNFAKIQIDYKPQNADGTLAAGSPVGWDQKTGVKV